MISRRFLRHTRVVLALVAGLIGFVTGIYLGWQNRTGNTSDEIAAAERRINNLLKDVGEPIQGLPPGILFIPAWSEIENATYGLTSENARIGRAQVLVHWDSKMGDVAIPSEYDSSIWQERYKLSKRPWQVQERSQRVIRSLLIGFSSGLASFLVILVSLFVLTWLWFFFLERVRELSRAIRGQ